MTAARNTAQFSDGPSRTTGDNNRLDANHDITLNWSNKQRRDSQRQQSAELNPIHSLGGPLGVLLFQGFSQIQFQGPLPSGADLAWNPDLADHAKFSDLPL
ncbi:hypothetical protein AWENTII_011518 [Aspergillus wentii]